MAYFPLRFLKEDDWLTQANAHFSHVSPITDSFLKRRSEARPDAVIDFLFTYYPFSPTKLKQWVPSYQEMLEVSSQSLELHPWLSHDLFSKEGNCVFLDLKAVSERVRYQLDFTSKLMENIMSRQPRFGCFGLHEWAMVYKQSDEEVRHRQHKLRMTKQELASFVEKESLCCTHYDAFRFFTPEAAILNSFRPSLDTRLEMEQGGCIHANMDLYKWSSKLWPWIGSDFIAKTFFLALKAREIDMRASPYDLSAHGLMPLLIETEEGKRQYKQEQMQLYKEAIPLRASLKDFCDRLLTKFN